MITRDNLKEVLESLTIEQINKEIDKNGDYVGLWLSFFNSGSVARLKSYRTANQEKHYSDNGQLFCDKDTFLQLLSEVNINL